MTGKPDGQHHNQASQTTDHLGTAELQDWHNLDVPSVLGKLAVTSDAGLTEAEVATRAERYGPNELVERGSKSPWRILWEQFTAVMVLILVGAAVLSAIVGDWKDTSVILAIVVLFGLLGFVQEYRAERAMAALKKLAVPIVRVRRNGRVLEIGARELVPGDIVLLEAGNMVPSDARLVDSVNLRVQEAALTGESEPVEKHSAALTTSGLALGDRRNMVYMGTVVTYGRAQAVVTTTGMGTELGRIATLLQDVKNEMTPLQKRLDQLGKSVGVIAILVAAVIFVLGFIRGQDIPLMFMTAVGVMVAAVPEGLPAVVTITLALGAQRMLRRNALLRKLPAVETLGSVTVIASDKTGTLTENKMTVTVIDVADHRIDLTQPLNDQGQAIDNAEPSALMPRHAAQTLLLAGGALCNDAMLQPHAETDMVQAVGDPTEGALVIAAHRLGLEKSDLETSMPRVAELPFDSERKRMTTVHRVGQGAALTGNQEAVAATLQNIADAIPGAEFVAFTKGSVDGLLDIASHVWTVDGSAAINAGWRDRIMTGNNQLAQQGMRVLGVAFRPLPTLPTQDEMVNLERGLTFVGLVGIIDPPRAEVKDAVATSKQAGIRPIMITGDHALTALHIAKQLGIASNDRVLTGQELDRMTVHELQGMVNDVSVYARVSPEHKLKIVEALQAKGQIVAMTGDGVNDAPALKKADIGVAMGITGTDVSKEAADMVLRDDNFATIVAAVEEGRVIYDNLRKFVKFSIAGNIGKVLTVLLGTALLEPVLGMPLALLPLQLLWLNLLTDGLLGLGLGVEGAERNVMQRPPQKPGESIFARGVGGQIVWVGLLIGVIALGLGVWTYQLGNPAWQTILFTSLAFAQIGQAFAIRSNTDSLFRIGLFSNRVLLGMAALVFSLQLLVLYWTPLQSMFGTQPLSAADFLLTVGAGALVFAAIEIEKWWRRRAERLRPAATTLEVA